MLTVATWNVNSIRARLDRLVAWLARRAPDVVCLQETKVIDADFPFEALRAVGYEAAVFGQRTYNGVAVLSRIGLGDVTRGLGDDTDARLIAVEVAGVQVVSSYVPNGKTLGSESYAYKLAWLNRLRAFLEAHFTPDAPVLVAGDFNVAPEERDVAHPEEWFNSVLFHPSARQALAGVTAWGLHDAFRRHHAENGLYSWWDYRALSFPKNDGLRIDQIWVTAPLLERCTDAFIDRDERKGEKPSDHAPVLATFDL